MEGYEYEGISSAGLRRAGRLLWPRWVEVRGCVLREDVAKPEVVAHWLAAAWAASLREAFPGRAFSIDVAAPGEDHGPTVYVVSER